MPKTMNVTSQCDARFIVARTDSNAGLNGTRSGEVSLERTPVVPADEIDDVDPRDATPRS